MFSHSETRTVPFTADQLFDLVAAVERYPEFLPWCLGARVRERSERHMLADLVVGAKGIRATFVSRVQLDRAHHIIETLNAGGPLKSMESRWCFRPQTQEGGQEGGQGCVVNFSVRLGFSSSILNRIFETFFTRSVVRMAEAFEARAHQCYGEGASSQDT